MFVGGEDPIDVGDVAFDRRRQTMTAMLNDIPGVVCPLPEGAFYCYPSVKGVLGKQIKVKWIDTKSDKPTAAANANELISKGAVAIIATCDFDFSFPAINAARSHKVPGIALAALSG